MRGESRISIGDGVYHEPSGSTSSFWIDPITKKECGPKIVKSIPKAKSPTDNAAARRRAALKWRGEYEKEIRERRTSRDNETMSQLADRWLVTRKEALDNGQLKPKTIEADERRVKTVKKFFADVPIDEIDPEMVRDWLRALKGGKASLSGQPQAQKTRAELLDGLQQMIDFKLAETRGGFNPCRGLAKGERPKQQRERDPIELTSEQLADFLYLAKTHTPSYLPLFTVVAYTGMRIREALALTWGDISADSITVTTLKQRASKLTVEKRIIAMPPQVEGVVGQFARKRAKWNADEDFIFAAGPGRPKSYRNVRRALASLSEKLGFGTGKGEGLRSHDFRHTLNRQVRKAIRTNEEKLAWCRSQGWVDTTMFDRVYGQGREEQEEMAAIAADVLARAAVGR